MEENLKNKFGFWFFVIIVLTLAIGGYFFTDFILNNQSEETKPLESKENTSYKIDDDKEYIYYKNEEVVSEKAEIYYKDVVINLKTQTTLNEALEKENKIYKNNIEYISRSNDLNKEIINYNNDDLAALKFREYKTYEFDKYVSLVINDYYYTCFDLTTYDSSKAYVFNVENGKLLAEDELLNLYNQTLESIKNKIRTHLANNQKTVEEIELIKIDETINNLNSYALYINEYGRLFISYLVKTTQVDYNEIMEVN